MFARLPGGKIDALALRIRGERFHGYGAGNWPAPLGCADFILRRGLSRWPDPDLPAQGDP